MKSSAEQGTRTPMRGDLRLLQIIDGNPAVVAGLIRLQTGRAKGGAAGAAGGRRSSAA
jgi:hypothetical protein